MRKKFPPGTWYLETRQLLKDRPRALSMEAISEATEIPLGWLRSFSIGRISDPSVNTVEVLNQFLKS